MRAFYCIKLGIQAFVKTPVAIWKVIHLLVIALSFYLVYIGALATYNWYNDDALYQKDKKSIMEFVKSLHLSDKLKGVKEFFTSDGKIVQNGR